MKNLFLLRHGHSPFVNEDHERPISAIGESQARSVGRYLKSTGIEIDQIICSSARRVLETRDHVIKELDISLPCKVDMNLYNCSEDHMLDEIQSTRNDVNNLLVVGHNPTLHSVAYSLVKDSFRGNVPILDAGYPPASLLAIQFMVDEWLCVDANKGEVIHNFMPR